MSTITTASGACISVGTEFPAYLTQDERQLIIEREKRVAKAMRSRPRKQVPDYMKPGPLTIIQVSR